MVPSTEPHAVTIDHRPTNPDTDPFVASTFTATSASSTASDHLACAR
jgi:hypothetical protein